jgi:ABC-type transport system involved in multi-copper enzyme maturation permease subunit
MDAVLSLIRITLLQQFRNRLYLVVLFFGAALLGASLLLGALAADQEVRVILDFGLAMMELFGLVAAIFGAVTLVLEEIESKTIYLILTRPLPRFHYLMGRFLGLLLAVGASILLMMVLHVLLLTVKGWSADPRYILSFPPMMMKIAIITALAVFFSLFSSSAATSVVFTVFVWLLGHFTEELEFLAHRTSSPFSGFGLKAVLVVIPRLSLFNVRDVIDTAPLAWGPLLWAAAYSALYIGAALSLAQFLFAKKEF